MAALEPRSTSKRVLVAHNVQRHGMGGMARMMESMHSALEEYGWQTEYFTSDSIATVKSARLRRHFFPIYVRRHVREAFLQGRPYDIINVHEPAGAAVVFARKALGRPKIVAMSHGIEQRHWEVALSRYERTGDFPKWRERITKPLTSLWQSKFALCKADHILCLNEQDRSYLSARFQVSLDHITRVFPGAGSEFAAVAQRRSYRTDGAKILFSGTWIERKGTRQMIAAFCELAGKYPDLQLGILGSGLPAAQVLTDFPRPLHARINVLPSLSHTECAEVLLAHDIFLLPSFFEGTPLALVEALYTGISVITTATAGMKDLVKNGYNGILISPGNVAEIIRAIEQLKMDAALRERLGRQAHIDAISKYTWQSLGSLVNRVYSDLLAQGI